VAVTDQFSPTVHFMAVSTKVIICFFLEWEIISIESTTYL